MKFRVAVRPLSESDISLDCPYTPSLEEYHQELELLLIEIKQIPQCISACFDRNDIYIDASFTNVGEMKNGLRSLFSKYICFIRFVDAEVCPDIER